MRIGSAAPAGCPRLSLRPVSCSRGMTNPATRRSHRDFAGFFDCGRDDLRVVLRLATDGTEAVPPFLAISIHFRRDGFAGSALG